MTTNDPDRFGGVLRISYPARTWQLWAQAAYGADSAGAGRLPVATYASLNAVLAVLSDIHAASSPMDRA
jgi:hypothetical protein